MNYGYYYAVWDDDIDDQVREWLTKTTGRTDIRKYDCSRSYSNPNKIVFKHKAISPSHYDNAKKEFGDKFDYFPAKDFNEELRHRQDLSLHIEKGVPLEKLDGTPELLSLYKQERGL